MMQTIWTDGATFPNPGRGGWAWTDLNGKERSGCEERTTNQRMELMAVIDAIERNWETGKALLIKSDSQYVINGATVWWKNWVKNDWRNSKGFPVANKELWVRLLDAMRGKVIKFEWVRGHSGDPGNERADELATEASGADPDLIEKLKGRWHE
jgi:ribonuclease HI